MDLAIHARLRQHLLNRLAYFLQRAQVLVVGKPLQRPLDPHPGLRVAQSREHPDLFRLELVDLAFEPDQVFLRVLRFDGELGQLLFYAFTLGFQLMLAADQNQRALVLVDVRRLPGLLGDFGQFGGLLLQLALELVAHVYGAGGRALELLIAPDAVRDRSFVYRLGVVRLARLEPAAELSADQICES